MWNVMYDYANMQTGFMADNNAYISRHNIVIIIAITVYVVKELPVYSRI